MILCLGAHPDDIELGLGGYLSMTNERKVGVTFTCQSAFRHLIPEMTSSWNKLDLNYFGEIRQDFRHRDIERQSLLDTMIHLRERFQPKIVFCHSSFDTHQDHKIIYQETLRAFKNTTILGYQLPWNDVNGSKYTCYKKLSLQALNKKLIALSCYKSQENRTYFNPEYQRSVAMVNGIESGVEYAEKFEVIRSWLD